MTDKLYLRDAEGGPWREYRGELLPGGAVAFPGPAAAAGGGPVAFVVGVDLGQVADYTALCVVEVYRIDADESGAPRYRYEVSHLERHRGISYPEVVQQTVALCAGLPAPPALAVDETGVGRAVCDQLRLAAPKCRWFVPITITPGAGAAFQPDGSWHVSKRELVGGVQVNLQNGRLKVAKKLPLAPVLVKEMLAFKAKITTSGNVVYGVPETSDWRNGVHDDLTLAVAVAVWAGRRVETARVDVY